MTRVQSVVDRIVANYVKYSCATLIVRNYVCTGAPSQLSNYNHVRKDRRGLGVQMLNRLDYMLMIQ